MTEVLMHPEAGLGGHDRISCDLSEASCNETHGQEVFHKLHKCKSLFDWCNTHSVMIEIDWGVGIPGDLQGVDTIELPRGYLRLLAANKIDLTVSVYRKDDL
ncbi:hypothetical protein A6X21_06880 [Planctopirus hydrillae]|uniref:Uncharacterized protein n=1 Tax=Planctopirus hydrillae TaxID=1841610 RepID=A0A1C3E9Z1_9PLAN|nr:hypothetical protein A6X21_06880 [Planctopirus hydrillae]